MMKNELDNSRMMRDIYDIPDYVTTALQEGGKLQSSQKTLNDRRVTALRIALALIEKEMGYPNE